MPVKHSLIEMQSSVRPPLAIVARAVIVVPLKRDQPAGAMQSSATGHETRDQPLLLAVPISAPQAVPSHLTTKPLRALVMKLFLPAATTQLVGEAQSMSQ